MTINVDALHSPDLAVLLRALPAEASDRVAEVIVAARRQTWPRMGSLHLERALSVQRLAGHLLVPDILDDLRMLTSHPPISAPEYRAMLRLIAQRHDIEDDGQRPAASVERDVQRQYKSSLRPNPEAFCDAGRTTWWQRAGFVVPGLGWVAYVLSPNWQVATAAVLEIAAHRRIAIARALRASMED